MSDTRQPSSKLRVETFEDRLALSTMGAHLIPPSGPVPDNVIISRGDGAQYPSRGGTDFHPLFGGDLIGPISSLPGGTGGDDTLIGGSGNDTVVGGVGNDII